jgi:tight adherence protein B
MLFAAFLVIGVAVIILGYLGWSMVHSARRQKRIETLVGSRQKKVDTALDREERDRRKAIERKLKDIEQRRAGRKSKLTDTLAMAGWDISVMQFVVLSVVLAALFGVVGLTMVSPGFAIIGASFGGFALPRFVIKFRTKRRIKKFTSLFADAIDIITRGVRSGLPLGECLAIIGREVPDPVGAEFRLLTESMRLGMTMDDALKRMSVRVPIAEVRFFAIVIAIQQQTGGNLADTLQKLSDVLRGRKRLRDKIIAMSQEAKTSAAIIGSLPICVAGILALVAPDYIGTLFQSTTGHWLLVGCGFVMGLGIMIMRAMINFEA